MIHPTALIDPAAIIGSDVKIGPFSIIHAGVQIGNRCEFHSNVVIYPGVKMGEENVVHANTVLGGLPQDVSFSPQTVSYVNLGNRNVFRENVTIHRGAKENSVTSVGNDCFLMAGAHMGHDSQIGDRVILANGVMLGGYVTVGDRAFLGGAAAAHQFVRIGRLAMTQGLSAISKDIPPFVMISDVNLVGGLNKVGLKRAGISLESINEIKAAFTLIYRSGMNVSQALAAVDERAWGADAMEFFDFVRTAQKRGICMPARVHSGAKTELS